MVGVTFSGSVFVYARRQHKLLYIVDGPKATAKSVFVSDCGHYVMMMCDAAVYISSRLVGGVGNGIIV